MNHAIECYYQEVEVDALELALDDYYHFRGYHDPNYQEMTCPWNI